MTPSTLLAEALECLDTARCATDPREIRRLVIEARSRCARAQDLLDWFLDEKNGDAFTHELPL